VQNPTPTLENDLTVTPRDAYDGPGCVGGALLVRRPVITEAGADENVATLV
jgi:hypothetical protein